MKKIDFVYHDGEFVRGEKSDFDCRKNPKGVFETMRSYNGCIFMLESHLKRLRSACILLGVKPPDIRNLKISISTCMKMNRVKNARIRLTAVACGKRLCIGLSVSRICGKAQGIKGYRIMVVNSPRRNVTVLSCVKSIRREFYDRLYLKAQSAGYDEAIFLNVGGFVVEGARTNVFLLKNGRLCTPALSVGCLPGITRSIVFKLARQGAVAVRQEGCISVADLMRADEVFVTNAVIGIMPVLAINGKPFGRGRPGEITSRFIKSYRAIIRRETAKPFTGKEFRLRKSVKEDKM